MGSLAIIDPLPAWKELVETERQSGEMPLPAVDSIFLSPGRPPTVILVAPGAVPGATKIFVNFEGMKPADELAMSALLNLLNYWIDARGELEQVWHLGGLDYEFRSREPEVVRRLSDLSVDRQEAVWSLLYLIAQIGAKYPDIEASTPQTVPWP